MLCLKSLFFVYAFFSKILNLYLNCLYHFALAVLCFSSQQVELSNHISIVYILHSKLINENVAKRPQKFTEMFWGFFPITKT